MSDDRLDEDFSVREALSDLGRHNITLAILDCEAIDERMKIKVRETSADVDLEGALEKMKDNDTFVAMLNMAETHNEHALICWKGKDAEIDQTMYASAASRLMVEKYRRTVKEFKNYYDSDDKEIVRKFFKGVD